MKRILVVLLTVVALSIVPMAGLAKIDQDASDQLHATQAMVRKAENVTLVGTHEFTYVLNGQSASVKYNDRTVIFHDPLIIHNTVSQGTPGGEPYHLFMVQKGDKMEVYSSHGSEEYLSYAEEIHQDELEAETMGELDAITHAIDAMIAAQYDGEETISVNGNQYECVRIKMTTHVLDYVEELVHNTLLASPDFDHAWSDHIEGSLAHLNVPFTYWIDKETGMLVQYTYDLTELYDGIYAYIPDTIDSGLSYTEYTHTYQVVGVNDAEEIVIPAKYIAHNEH